MKTYFSDLIPGIQRFSKKLDDLTLLTGQHWVVLNEIQNSKTVYFFKKDSTLLISNNGRVQKGKWEYLGNNSLLIETASDSFLFKHGFFDENVLALKVDGKEEYAFLVNENKFNRELDNIERIILFLEEKYLPLNHNAPTSNAVEFDPSEINYTFNRITKNLNDGRVLSIYSTSKKLGDYNTGDQVSLDGYIPEDGNYHFGWTGCITVKNGKIRY